MQRPDVNRGINPAGKCGINSAEVKNVKNVKNEKKGGE